MADLAILVPVLNRPHRVRPLLNSIASSTPDAEVVFVCDRADRAECEAVEDAETDYPMEVGTIIRGGGYAPKINDAVRQTVQSLVFLGADDLDFTPGWFEQAQAHLSDTVQVVGVNDLVRRRRRHTTHFLLTREYALKPCLDGSRGPLHEGYAHNWVDDELIATAQSRGAYVYAPRARVKHLHPYGGGGQDDATYRKGRASFHRDRRLFERRQQLWT
jgi:glycosyltransferase involved in cell wall biosynthesis